MWNKLDARMTSVRVKLPAHLTCCAVAETGTLGGSELYHLRDMANGNVATPALCGVVTNLDIDNRVSLHNGMLCLSRVCVKCAMALLEVPGGR